MMEVEQNGLSVELEEDKKPVVATFESDRIAAKNKKRTRRDSSKKEGAACPPGATLNINNSNGSVPIRPSKFGDKKSRSLYGRGLPKKGGAGGKGTWGRLGDEIAQDPVDDHDPNYDSTEEQDHIMYKAIKPEWNSEEVERTVVPILQEYFEHTDVKEAIDTLRDLNIDGKKSLVVICLVTLAMERKNEFREMASALIKACVTPQHQLSVSNGHHNGNGAESGKFGGSFLTRQDVAIAFGRLCAALPELILDTPDAPDVLAKFVARAVFDQVITEDIIDQLKNDPDRKLSCACASDVRSILTIPHNNLRNVWGKAGPHLPLNVLKDKMTILLKEYLSSGDSEEAMRCARELDVPHFHHELVYEAVTMAIEDSSERACNMLVHLLKRFADTAVVTSDQFIEGFQRVYTEMPDINLDVPNAYFYLEQIVNKCYDLKVIPLKLKVKAPNRSRKRFVSEGDGGRLKNYRYDDRYFDMV